MRKRMTSYTIALMCALALAGTAARAQTGAHITFGINPTIFRAGQPANAELSVSSNYYSLTLYPGNTFSFFVDSSLGTVGSFTPLISVDSTSLLAGDFSVSFGANQSQINVTYNGQAKPFAYGDALSVKVSLMASAQAGPGKLSLSSQFVSAVNGNLPFTSVSIVDFANSGTSAVTHDQSLMGEGTGPMPLGIAPGGVTSTDLATGAVTAPNIAPGAVGNFAIANGSITASKIANGTVVRSLNNLTDNVTVQAGSNITITPSGNTLTIAGTDPPPPSVAYTAHGISKDLTGGGVVVVSKVVPAGNYVISFKTGLFNHDADPQTCHCSLSTGDGAGVRIEGLSFGFISLQDTATFSGPTTISVTCGGFNISGTGDITALKVGSIQ